MLTCYHNQLPYYSGMRHGTCELRNDIDTCETRSEEQEMSMRRDTRQMNDTCEQQ